MTRSAVQPQNHSHRVIAELRREYPQTAFLALGQTVWWDEPMKAVLRLLLDSLGLGGRMILGIHDTDYFAKLKVREAGHSRFELLPHNDGSTKELWSAAGEISRLFGSETFPTRAQLNRHGVPIERLARASGDRQKFINENTEAWGWRGLVYTGSRDLIVHSLPLAEVGGAIRRMLEWGFRGTEESIVDECCRREAHAASERMLALVDEFIAGEPDATLSSLYRHLIPILYRHLLGRMPHDIEVACTAHLLRLSPDTAGLPRFELANLFIDERTRSIAREAYNHAVGGSEMYTLDRFGLGAVPFDVVLPQHGRGTLRITLRALHIETRSPLRIPLRRPVASIHDLAAVLAAEFGDNVTLVGKAVALISMLAREFIFVFSEEGSQYVSRTRTMNDFLRARGIEFEQHPILRMKYRTWDALAAGQASLRLPDHLAAAFETRDIPSHEFAGRWRTALERQEALLSESGAVRKPRALMGFLARERGDGWGPRREAYVAAKERLCQIRDEAEAVQFEVRRAYSRLAEVKSLIRETERAKSDHFRAASDWTPEALRRREEFGNRIEALLQERRALLADIRRMKAMRLEIERGPEASLERSRIAEIEIAAETARLALVRDALLTLSSLPHTDHRPSAWWLPLLDPSGRWFRTIAETTEFYTQAL